MTSTESTPPQGLLQRIMRRLGLERQLVALRSDLRTSLVFLGITVAGVASSVVALVGALRLSSFLAYAMLVRSDFRSAAHVWRPLTGALVESIPATLVAIVCLAMAATLMCIRLAAGYWERMEQISVSIQQK